MSEGYFSPWGGVSERDCHTCRYSIGTPDGWHLWCEQHRQVVVFPCGWWEREAGADGRGSGFARMLGASDSDGEETPTMQLEGIGVIQPDKNGPFQLRLKFGKQAYCVVELRRGEEAAEIAKRLRDLAVQVEARSK